MALGGRPKEEAGHKPLKISVNKFVSEALEKIDNKSQFIEQAVEPILRQLDPGDSCGFIRRVDVQLQREIMDATRNKNFGKVMTLGYFARWMEPYRQLCATTGEQGGQLAPYGHRMLHSPILSIPSAPQRKLRIPLKSRKTKLSVWPLLMVSIAIAFPFYLTFFLSVFT